MNINVGGTKEVEGCGNIWSCNMLT